jgi:hypothetical protein
MTPRLKNLQGAIQLLKLTEKPNITLVRKKKILIVAKPSKNWIYSFLGRWPEITLGSLRKRQPRKQNNRRKKWQDAEEEERLRARLTRDPNHTFSRAFGPGSKSRPDLVVVVNVDVAYALEIRHTLQLRKAYEEKYSGAFATVRN